jgi:hypothetical protein
VCFVYFVVKFLMSGSASLCSPLFNVCLARRLADCARAGSRSPRVFAFRFFSRFFD